MVLRGGVCVFGLSADAMVACGPGCVQAVAESRAGYCCHLFHLPSRSLALLCCFLCSLCLLLLYISSSLLLLLLTLLQSIIMNNKSSSNIALSHLALRPSSLQLLSSRGFSTLAEVQASLAVAGGIWRELQQTNNPQPSVVAVTTKPQTAHSLLTSQNSNTTSTTSAPIITFCRDVDQLLQGGIALGELTEIAGEPGAGKTQWGMQLAVDVSLPTWAGGVNGECIYIDTEGSFGPERVQRLANALVQHLQTGLQRRKQRAKENSINNNNHTASSTTNSNTNKYPWEDVEYTTTAQDILQGIHVIRVHDLAELQATLEGTVPELCRQQRTDKPIKLLVVDSLAFPIRAAPPPSMDPTLPNRTPDTFSKQSKHPDDAQFYVARTRQLTLLAQQLSQLAVTFQLAAVAMNQMTTKMTKSGTTTATSSSSHLVPALGESWAHAVTTRLILSSPSQQQQQQRTCALVKSPRLASGVAHYQILDCGVRAMDHCSSGRGSRPWSSGSNSSLDDTYHSEPKRSRMSTDC